MVENNLVFRATLTTKGRKTGQPHTVMLRAVKHNDKIYFSRHRPDGDWFQNSIKNPEVIVEFNGIRASGFARLVNDESMKRKISELKYPNEERAKENRVAIEVTLYEQP